jgi:hypothetical protein
MQTIYAAFICAVAIRGETICTMTPLMGHDFFRSLAECEQTIPAMYRVPNAVPRMICMQKTVPSWQPVR